jgi:hypothetical protein
MKRKTLKFSCFEIEEMLHFGDGQKTKATGNDKNAVVTFTTVWFETALRNLGKEKNQHCKKH